MFGRGKKSSGGNNPSKSDQVRKQNVDMFGMPDLSEFAVKDDFHVSDDVLEAELAALLDEDDDGGGNARPARRQQRPAPAKPAVDPMQQIAMMANEVMKDVDEADDDDDDDDLDDEDLLAELAGISGSAEKPPPNLNVPASKATPRTPSPGPRPAVGQTPSPKPRPAPSPKPDTGPGLAPEPTSTRRSPSPARKPVPAGPSPGTTGEPTDLASLLQHRAGCYQQAIASAERAEEGSKVRRYKRQLKVLQDMQKKVKLGKPVNKDEIPPEVYVPKQAEDAQPPPQENVPAPAASQPTSAPEQEEPSASQSKKRDESRHQMLCVRRDQYKMAALLAKRANDMATAAEYLKISKQFEAVIGAVEAGEEVDLSDMPPPPPSAPKANASAPAPAPAPAPPSRAPVAAARPSTEGGGGGGYAQPKTDLEAMLQRRERYSSMAQQAKEAQNDSKARRIGRIVKQYDDTIRKKKLGKPVDLSELAALPEFPPFPSQSGGEQAPPQVVHTVAGGASAPAATRPPAPGGPAAGGPSGHGTRASHQASSQRPENSVAAKRPQSAKESMNQRNIAILKSKIAQFKSLALAAKRKGDMYEAKRLLKIAKEIEPMLAAAEGGLPVNMASIPKLPVEESVSSVSPPASPEPVEGFEVVGDAQDIYSRLIATLQKQIDICAKNAEIYGKLGNIKSVNRFKEYQEHCQQDLDVLVSKQSRGEPIPRHHYEQRTLPSVRVFPDIKESEAEITIIQGTMLHCPSDKDAKDIDTYIKAEFPYPSDEPQGHKTGWAKGAENPVYNSTFTVDIGRGSRAFGSVVKRKALKMEVVYSKGLLRGHKTLGAASVKLADLESKCEIHESVPLMEGRKEIGGKIEVKIRIHHPLSGMKEDFIKEKWLIVDSVQRKAANPTSSSTRKPGSTTAGSSTQARSSATDSIEVLKWEIGTLKKKIADMQTHHQQVPKEFVTSYTALQERLQKLQTFLREGGPKAKQAYASRLASVAPNFLAQAKEALQAGQKEKASMYMTKKKLVETELAALNRR